jgi:Secretion system C-terminal sorting domain
MKSILLSVMLLVTANVVLAQIDSSQGKKTSVMKIRVNKNKDGKTETFEKTYNLENMSEQDRKKQVKIIMDSIRVEGGDQQVSVNIDENREQVTILRGDGSKPIIVHPKNGSKSFRFDSQDGQTFHFDMPNQRVFADRMKRMEKRMAPRLKKLDLNLKSLGDDIEHSFNRSFDIKTTKPSTVRSLEAYPNNPDKNELNVRFHAPNKGDVSISITDTKGKTVAQKSVKDFSGNFVGQLDLGKNPKGTFFITVVQNEDGATKRIVIE